jgi:hypothetical protein
MSEFTKDGRPLISVVRVIEYHGPKEWVQATLESSRIAILGKSTQALRDGKPFPEGCYINSGQVLWDDLAEDTRAVIPIPPGSTSIQ